MNTRLRCAGSGMKAKLAVVAVTLAVSGAAVFVPVAALADHTTAHTIEQLSAQIAALQAQLLTLSGSTPAPVAGATKCTFTHSLTVGSKGDDVMCLQKYLNSAGFQVAASGSGSPGSETTYFGNLTRTAVGKWQAANNVSPAAGYFGPLSQAKYNMLVAAIPPPPPPPTGTTTPPVGVGSGITVTAAVDQPPAALAPASAARVPFTKVILTASPDGDVKVSGLTVERQHSGSDSGLSEVVLLDEKYMQIGLAKTLNSIHQVNLNESFTVKAGTSKTVYLGANRAASGTSVSGEIIKLALVAVDAGATKVTATYPIVGNGMTMNTTLTIGTVTQQTGAYKTVATTTEDIGLKAFIFTSVRVTAGSQEKVLVQGIRWNQVGSIGQGDIANLKTVLEPVGGTKQEYDVVASADGKYYTSTFGAGVEIDKGASAEIYVKGDIVSGSNRTIKFDIYRTSDLAVSGQTYGFGITPPTSGTGFTSSNPWYFASQVTVSKGTLNIENSTTVASQNVAINLSGQPLGAITVEARGESISVAQMVFNIGTDDNGTASVSAADMTNVALYDENGKVVAGPQDGAAADTITFSDTVTFPVGKHIYTLKGKYGTDFGSNNTVQASTTPSSDWTTVKGVTTGETITPAPASAISLSTMTVKAASIALSVSTNPPAQTVVSGAQKFVFARYLLDATASGEDIRMPSIPLEYNTASTATNLTACELYDGATLLTTGSNAVNPSAAASSTVFTFDGAGFTTPKGTVKTLELKCNIASGASGTYAWGYNAASSPTATGLTSGQSATITENDSAGQLMTLATSGSFTVALDSSSPSFTITAAGRTDIPVAVYRITTTNEAVRINDFALQLTSGTSGAGASTSPTDVTRVTLWDGASKVGEATFVGTSYVASTTLGTCTGCVKFEVPKDSSKLLTAKVDLVAQGVSQAGLPGSLVRVDWDNASGDATKGTGLASGQTIQRTSDSDTASDGVRVYKSYPTLELVNLASTKFTAGRPDLFRFKITAAAEGDVSVAKFTFRIATSSPTTRVDMVDNANIYVFTDSGYSTVASGVQSDGAISSTNLDLSSKWGSASTDLEIWAENSSSASTTVVIPANGTRYFAIRGDSTIPSDASYSVSTQVQGDAKFASDLTATAYTPTASSTYMATSSYLHAGGHNDFIWRPFSTTTTQSLNANDYTTGYGIPGLSNTNTNTQILTQ